MIDTLAGDTEDIWGYAKRLRFVRDMIRSSFAEAEVVTVLDVGCGNGSQLAIPLAQAKELHITAMDPDAVSIAHGQRLAESKPNLKFICATIEDLPQDTRFDVVILSEVLEHLDKPANLLERAVRFLKPNSLLIVTVPNGYGEFEIDSWIFRALRLQKVVDLFATRREVLAGTDNSESGHVQFFTRARLHKLFRAAGLSIVREGNSSFLAGPIAGHFIARSRRLVEWNARITDQLPFIFASGWYFVLQLDDSIARDRGQK